MGNDMELLPSARQFFSAFSNINVRLFATSTSTVYVTTTTSATTIVDGGTCVSYALIKDAAAALSTCRKKRELAEFSDLLAADSHEPVAPTQVVP